MGPRCVLRPDRTWWLYSHTASAMMTGVSGWMSAKTSMPMRWFQMKPWPYSGSYSWPRRTVQPTSASTSAIWASSTCWAGQPATLAVWRRSPLVTSTTSLGLGGAGSVERRDGVVGGHVGCVSFRSHVRPGHDARLCTRFARCQLGPIRGVPHGPVWSPYRWRHDMAGSTRARVRHGGGRRDRQRPHRDRRGPLRRPAQRRRSGSPTGQAHAGALSLAGGRARRRHRRAGLRQALQHARGLRLDRGGLDLPARWAAGAGPRLRCCIAD